MMSDDPFRTKEDGILQDRQVKFEEALDDISKNMYSDILHSNMTMSQRIELVKMRYYAKAAAFTNTLSQEIYDLKDIAEQMDLKQRKFDRRKSLINKMVILSH